MTALLFQRLTSKVDVYRDSSTTVAWNPHPWEVRQAVEILGIADAIFDSRRRQQRLDNPGR